MRLTASEYVALEQALLDAFTGYDELGLSLAPRGDADTRHRRPGPLLNVVGRVIQFTESRDSIDILVSAARSWNPNNVGVLRVAAALGLEPGGPSPSEVPIEEALASATANLERMVNAQRGIADLSLFAAKIQELLRQVCAVEVGEEFGTGFLIEPDTVLTNYHVVAPAIEREFEAADICVRFDYQRMRDGIPTNDGVLVQLADDWLVKGESTASSTQSLTTRRYCQPITNWTTQYSGYARVPG